MSFITDEMIETIAGSINSRINKSSSIPVNTVQDDSRSPNYFEIISFENIDDYDTKFFAIDGSYVSQEFQNGVGVALYTAGYICYQSGKEVRLNDKNDVLDLGKKYLPKNILLTNENDKRAILEELITLDPVKNLIQFFDVDDVSKIWGLGEKTFELLVTSTSKLLSFCQEILEWSLVYEILIDSLINEGDYILRDGTLRSNNIKQEYLIKIGRLAKSKNVKLIAVTKSTPIKLELSSAFRSIDEFLESSKKPNYPFTIQNKRWQKLCCWFEVNNNTLISAYPEARQNAKVAQGILDRVTNTSMFAKNDLTGGRGFGVFFVARLDYVEKLQNYDWVVMDLNIFDVVPALCDKPTMNAGEVYAEPRNVENIQSMIKELTRLTQEHYILGYPYPLVEAHNYVTLSHSFKDEIVNRVKSALYLSKRMDNVEIENMFLDIHSKF